MKPNHPSRKVLIIKTGYTETLTNEPYREGDVSLGDVLRSTAILHLYKNDFVIWLTDEKAVPLLRNNPYIREILIFNNSDLLRLRHEYFDIVINLEKNAGLCALASSINAWQKYGFRFEPFTGTAEAYNGAIEALYMAQDARSKEKSTKHWLDHLYTMVGQQWKNQGYVLQEPLGFKYGHTIVALNWRVGHKFDGKKWPMTRWMELKIKLEDEGLTTNLQPEEIELDDYIKWIHSHTVIVSCDSLGLHLGMALDKRVVGLFGPTPIKELHPYKKGIFVKRSSMSDFTVDEVHSIIKSILSDGLC